MQFVRTSRDTITPCELNHGDTLCFTLSTGERWEMTLLGTSAEVIARGPARHRFHGDIAAYAFTCELAINGRTRCLRREVGTQASFADPVAVDGVRIWFDAVADIFATRGGFMEEKDWRYGYVCQPHRHARFALQEVGRPLCPEPLFPWYPMTGERLAIADCYNGEDCWLGPYGGAQAHCGLDINMPAGTLLSAPISFDDQYYVNSVAAGANNNRWRGIRRWPDGSEWWLQSHHLITLLVPERTPLRRGVPYATTAGVFVGDHEHTHFLFRILDHGGDYFLDPWILFREMWPRQR